MQNDKQSNKKELVGNVISDKMIKTAVVAVEVPKRHPSYNKEIKNTKKFKVHNTLGAKIGDRVRIGETKPISKDKAWIILEVLK